ncbi:unnamed protein product [Boreogadus saida]
MGGKISHERIAEQVTQVLQTCAAISINTVFTSSVGRYFFDNIVKYAGRKEQCSAHGHHGGSPGVGAEVPPTVLTWAVFFVGGGGLAQSAVRARGVWVDRVDRRDQILPQAAEGQAGLGVARGGGRSAAEEESLMPFEKVILYSG